MNQEKQEEKKRKNQVEVDTNPPTQKTNKKMHSVHESIGQPPCLFLSITLSLE
jgi:hypothetical protein